MSATAPGVVPGAAAGVERDRQRLLLIRHVSRVLISGAAERRSVMVSVRGDAGHGKSNVIESIRREVGAQRIAMLSMSGSAVTSTMPYAALYEMLTHESAHRAAPGLIAELSSFRSTTSPLAVSAAVSKWLLDGSGGRPLLVTVDDADLVDDDSLRVLAYAAARVPSTSMLHAITRPVPLLERLLVQEFQLDDLGAARAMSVAVDAGASDRDAETLVAEFGGNPLALVHGGETRGRRMDDGELLVSGRLIADVQQRLRGVAPDVTRLLEASAVTRVSRFADLAALTEPFERGIDVLADEIEDTGMAEVERDEVNWRRRWMRAAVAARCSEQRRERWSVRAGKLTHPSACIGRRTVGLPELTNGELRVVEVVVSGASTRQAAAQLHLSEKTVESHLQSVYRKLDVHSRVQLAVIAHDHRLFDGSAPIDAQPEAMFSPVG